SISRPYDGNVNNLAARSYSGVAGRPWSAPAREAGRCASRQGVNTMVTMQAAKKAGLAFWSARVVTELEKVIVAFDPDPVHDLRGALRGCLSMADGFREGDPDPGWKQLKKLGKPLFSRLGHLRDMQVMEEWILALGGPDDAVGQSLLQSVKKEEQELKAG